MRIDVTGRAARENSVNLTLVQDISLFTKAFDGHAGQLHRRKRSQRAAHSAKGGTHTVYNYNFSHLVSSFLLFFIHSVLFLTNLACFLTAALCAAAKRNVFIDPKVP